MDDAPPRGPADEAFEGVGADIWITKTREAVVAADSALDQPLNIHRTSREMVKTELEGVLQIVQMKVLGAPRIRSIQKRTMVLVFSHSATGDPARVIGVIG